MSQFFIVGMPRSGTTLVAERLAALRSVSVSRETHFYPRHWHAFRRIDPGDRGQVRAFLRDVMANDGFRYGADTAVIEQAAERFLHGEGRQATDCLESLIRALGHDTRFVGEKTPRHLEWVPVILRERPEARVLVVVRDPRAVSLSLMDVPWGADDPAVHAARWKAYANATLEFCERYENVTYIRYEDLVGEPDEVVGRTAHFLGVPAEDVRGVPSVPRTFDPNAEPWKSRAAEEMDAARAERWRDELPAAARAVIEFHCSDEMDRFGYERGTRWYALSSPAAWRSWMTVHSEIRRHRRRFGGISDRAGSSSSLSRH